VGTRPEAGSTEEMSMGRACAAACLACLCLATSGGAEVPPPIAHWTLDDAGAEARDAAGAHHGVVRGATSCAGRVGRALLFDRGRGDHVAIPFHPDFEISSFSVASWVRLTKPPTFSGILGTRFNGNFTFDMKVNADKVHGDVGDGKHWIETAVNFYKDDAGRTGQGGDLDLDRWYLVTFVIDDSRKEFRLYLDGDRKKTIPYAGVPKLMQRGQEMHIGHSSGDEYMDGAIDEVRIWNRPLGDDDVAALAQPPEAQAADAKVPARPTAAMQFCDIDGRRAFVILPPAPAAGRPIPWVGYMPCLLDQQLPGASEDWMFARFLAAGIAVARKDAGHPHGNPRSRELFTRLHEELTTRRGFAPRVCLLARSRGGLFAYNWASEHPQLVAGIAGIYPVCDLRSYPGLDRACRDFGLSAADLAAQLDRHNPVDRLEPLAKAGVPLFAIHGDRDALVPLDANSAAVKRRYQEFGGQMQVVVPAGQGHTMWEGFFRCQELVDFVIEAVTQKR
jgi:hypothetical protein